MGPNKAAAPLLFFPSKLARTVSEGSDIILGKYKLGRLLGRGSFAKVYQGKSIANGQDVAVKIIDKSNIPNRSMEQLIIWEVSAMCRLRHHPHILRLYEVMATKSKIYLVMELAQGGELSSKLVRAGKFSESTARRYLQQIVAALRFCHQNGIAHRDIKPQNVLLDKSGNVKVSDFGLSALPEQIKDGMLHTACGTPAYTAPEVISRKGYNGAMADSWSCGVMLFVLLSGYLPFDDTNLAYMYRKILRRDFKMPDWISKPAKSIIHQLLDPNPVTRMSIDALTEHSWFKKSMEAKNLSVFDGFELAKDYPYMTKMNAFDIISLSWGLNLSGLFEGRPSMRERRFTAKATVEAIEESLERAGKELGYTVTKRKGQSVGLVKGRMLLSAEILEVAKDLLMVELRVMVAGMELDEHQWEELKAGLGDIALSWHTFGIED